MLFRRKKSEDESDGDGEIVVDDVEVVGKTPHPTTQTRDLLEPVEEETKDAKASVVFEKKDYVSVLEREEDEVDDTVTFVDEGGGTDEEVFIPLPATSAEFPKGDEYVVEEERRSFVTNLLCLLKKKRPGPAISLDDLGSVRYVMPDIPGKKLVEYPVDGEFAKAVIAKTGPELVYYLIMPRLPIDKDTFEELRDEVYVRAIEKQAKEAKGSEFFTMKVPIGLVFSVFLDLVKDKRLKLTKSELSALWTHLLYSTEYAGVITPLLLDGNLEDISCSGYRLPFYVYHRKWGWLKTNIVLTPTELDDLAQVLAHKANKTITHKNPIADFSLPDFKARVNVVYGTEKSPKGTSITIRKARGTPLTPLALVAAGTFTVDQVAMLWLALRHKLSMMIIGETASGKTTALNATALLVEPWLKIVSVEDTPEISLPHEHWTALTIPPNAEDKDREAYRMIEAFLRMRPDYIIMGEARGREVHALLQAAMLGYSFLSTMHAGDSVELVRRLASDPLKVEPSQMTALRLIITMKNVGSRDLPVRKCTEIGFLNMDDAGDSLDKYARGVSLLKISTYDVSKDETKDKPNDFLRLVKYATGLELVTLQEEYVMLRSFLEKAYSKGVVELNSFVKELRSFFEETRGV